MRLIRNVRMRTKLIILLMSVGLMAVIAVSTIAWFTTQSILRDQTFEQLVSVREDRVDEIESYFESLRLELLLLGQDETIRTAMSEFTLAFNELDALEISAEIRDSVTRFYEVEFLPNLEINLRQELDPEPFLPNTNAGLYLQNQYIASNDNLLGSKHFLDFAPDGSGYSDSHRRFHPFLRTFVNLFGYYDLFLIEPEQRRIVYSVSKEVDFATSLADGTYADSGLAQVVDLVLQDPIEGEIEIVDFSPYDPSYQAPAAFFAMPIYAEETLLGVMAVQVPLNEINNIMTSNQQWEEHGLGASGETYLVGEDLLMRSMSRLLIEDKGRYIAELAAAGVEQEIRDNVNNLGTSILQQKIETESAEKAIADESGIHIIEDYRGAPVLSAYAPLNVAGLNWSVIAEIEVAEINEPIIQQQSFFLLAAGGLAVGLIMLSYLIAHSFTRHIRQLTQATRQIGAGNFEIEEIPVISSDEVGQLANAFNLMAASLRDQREQMQSTTLENDRLLLSILPDSIAERVKKGEGDIAEEVDNVTVMFAYLSGVHELTLRHSNRKLVAEQINILSERLEYAALDHGVDRQPTVSNRYVAVCGLNGEGDDHVERIVRYAMTCMKTVEEYNRENQLELALKIGIHTGTVLAALLDENRFRFDLWGTTVEVTERLEEEALGGMILVSHEVYEVAQEMFQFAAHDPIIVDGSRPWRVWQLIPPDNSTLTDRFAMVLADAGNAPSLPPSLKPRRKRIGLRRFGRKKV